ncbi:hypothetical protein BK720_25395 [Bacillus thuringiensis serovar brasilensis]|uniref:hypothetical protein n=1 Tax=Bacillus cereus group TaxID=86661 RepID=UPI000A367B1D|nr:hypothetical protein [Bacillus thuringiensis]MCU5032118.1 hypothetical protein [Bacillus cereus]MRA70014.1 hypothetical protein [Bacillus thuringiensis]MRA88496.1 hypothetical protein [Bacillus thuringiensis]MRC51782.1 hypothetical protein [Bacillus thuringiensis]OTX26871.1 hypothetical protein BK720_25395 [Bacillus thuringiensis serovar brasilensis]
MKEVKGQNNKLMEEFDKLLRQLLIKSRTDERVKHFLDDLFEMLNDNKLQFDMDFKTELNKLREKHFPKFDKGESKND